MAADCETAVHVFVSSYSMQNTFTFYFESTLEFGNANTLYFYLPRPTLFCYFYLYLSKFLSNYLYFYLSIQLEYFIQHWWWTLILLVGKNINVFILFYKFYISLSL